jgi:hypothetical protein
MPHKRKKNTLNINIYHWSFKHTKKKIFKNYGINLIFTCCTARTQLAILEKKTRYDL